MLFRPRSGHARLLSALFMITALFVAALGPVTPGAAAAPNPPNGPGGLPASTMRIDRTLINFGGYLSEPNAGDAEQIAREFILRTRAEFGLSADDLRDLQLVDRYVSPNNGLTHLYFRQRAEGIGVFNADININVAADGRILNMGNLAVPHLQASINTTTARLDAPNAVRRAAAELGLKPSEAIVALNSASGADDNQLLSDGGISQDDIPVRLVYMPVAPGDVRLSWEMTLHLLNGEDWLFIRADAETGAILSQINYGAHSDEHIDVGGEHAAEADHDHGHGSHAEVHVAGTATGAARVALQTGVNDGSSYLAYAFPKENPYDGDRTLIENPADPTASPFGWHDTDGAAGPEFTGTRGNNVHAYADMNDDDEPDGPGPDGGPGLDFSPALTIDPNDPVNYPDPLTYQDASIVNLFYANNYIHDVLARNGFDEAAGNFQVTNYSGQGTGNDDVQAQAQDNVDGGAAANANFFTPPEGERPRMQMYLGLRYSDASLTLSPGGEIAVGTASFGPQNFNTTGEIVLVDDANTTDAQGNPTGGSISDGCQTIVNNITGKIALIDRGVCAFAVKVANAQAAGAVGVIIADNAPSSVPSGMSGTDDSITIGSLRITLDAGNALKAAMGEGVVNGTLFRASSEFETDGSLDNGVIAHEYGHGLSNRLTGGPSNAGCLANSEQAGEGWSDLLTLILNAQPTDTAETPIAIGNWLMNQPVDGIGIRQKLYSTDTAINNHTYDAIKNAGDGGGQVRPHDVGEVWATTVWDMYWLLVEKYGFDADLINGNGGNRMALQLIIDGLKLQNCSPSFVDARNGILSADVANNAGANQCVIWDAFARRGLGYSANAGSAFDHTDGTEAYDLPPLCTLDVEPKILDRCINTPTEFAINVGESFPGPVILSQEGAPGTATISNNPAATASSSTLSISDAIAGTSTITITGAGPDATYTTIAQLNLADAPAAAPTLSAPAEAAENVTVQPTLGWEAAAQAASYRVELDDEPTFTDALIDTVVRTNSYLVPERLRDATTYYWRVTALNGCGDSPLSYGSFSTRDYVDVLLMDDTIESVGSQTIYKNALDALGVPYDFWYGVSGDDEPPLGILNNYRTVIWYGGYDFYGTPSLAGQERLQNWLPGGHCLLMSSEELFARSNATITPFISDTLGVGVMADDSVHTEVTAQASGIFDGLGSMPLTFAGNNYSDHMEPNAAGVLQLSGNGTKGSGAMVSHDAGTYRTLYAGFPLEALSTGNLESVLLRSLNWCNDQAAVDLRVSLDVEPAREVLLPGQTITYTIDFRNDGNQTASGAVLNLSLPSLLSNVSFSNSGPALTLVENSNYEWTIADMAAGASGSLIVTATVDSTISAAGEGRLEVALSGGGSELNADNQSQAALLRARVPTVSFSPSDYSAAEADGSVAITVQISEANPYAASSIGYSVAGGTASAGSDFVLEPGTVSIPAGATSATFSVTLNSDAVADDGETVLLALSSPQGAALGAPAGATLTISDSEPPPPPQFDLYLPLINQ